MTSRTDRIPCRVPFLAVLGLLLGLVSCELPTEDGRTTMTIRQDTAWAAFDSLEISWMEVDGGGGGLIFRGDPATLKASNRFSADGYEGQKIRIVFKGYVSDSLVFEEHRVFDSAEPGKVEKTRLPVGPAAASGPVLLSSLQADTAVSIHDSVGFSANARVEKGRLKAYAWDFDGDGTSDDSASLSGAAAVVRGGARYREAKTYAVRLRVYSTSDSVGEARLDLPVRLDPPVAEAGEDQTVFPGDEVRLLGKARDGLGRLVRQEWRIGEGPFEAGEGARTFTAPETVGEVVARFRVTDDDTLSTVDEVVVHVVSRSEATLTGIGVSAGRLSPQFNPGVLGYADTVEHAVESITVTPTGNGNITVEGAEVESGKSSPAFPLKVGSNPIALTVKLGGGAPKTYSLAVVRRAPDRDADLAGLSTSAGPLDSPFDPADLRYTVAAPASMGAATVTATLANPASGLSINGFTANSGQPSGAITLKAGSNPVSLVVTAPGGASKSYIVDIVRATGGAGLSSLSISSGSLQPGFSPGTFAYSQSVGEDVGSIQVTAVASVAGSRLSIQGRPAESGVPGAVTLVTGANTIEIAVTEPGGDAVVYAVRVTRAGNKNADLSSLALSSGDLQPAFNADGVFYTADVPHAVESLSITAAAAKETSALAVNGERVASGAAKEVPLEVGLNPLTVSVTAESGDKKAYTVVVTRAKSADADLKSLVLSSGSFSPVFAPGIFAYASTQPNEVSTITLTPTASAAASTVTVNGMEVAGGVPSPAIALRVGETPIEVGVTAQSGAVRVYTLKITRLPNSNADLSGLVLSADSLDSGFDPGRTAYRASLSHGITHVTISATAARSTSTLTVNGQAVASGSASPPLPLQVGTNAVEIVVTAESGFRKAYTITLAREGSGNADLSGLSVSAGSLDSPFSASDTSYAVTVAHGVTSFTVTAKAADSAAVLTIFPAATVALKTGPNTLAVEVRAQSGARKTYTLVVTRAGDADAGLADLKLSDGAIPLDFAPGTLVYPVSVANPVASLTVMPTASSAASSITVRGNQVASGTASGAIALEVGANEIPVVVTAENGTTRTYRITVTRANDNPEVSGLRDTTLSINDAITFSLSASDPQGIRRYLWDFNADGTPDATTSTGTYTRTFPGSPGRMDMVVTVEDNAGGSTQVRAVITIVQDPPTVSAGRDTNVAVGRPILVRGSASDRFGRITLLEWSIGGGPFIRASKPETTLTAPATQTLNYPVVLRATDDDGNTVTATLTVKVEKINTVVVGDLGFIATTSDGGATWTRRLSGVNDLLDAVVWTGSQFVAVGRCILTSPDGISWTLRSARNMPEMTGLAWNGRRLVAVGVDGIIRTSEDGLTWSLRNSGTSTWIKSIAWGGSRFAAVTDEDVVYTSPDGISWTGHATDEEGSQLRDLTWTGSRFVAVGGRGIVRTSPDGEAWTSQDPGGAETWDGWYSVGSSPGGIMIVGSAGNYIHSQDAVTWNAGTMGVEEWIQSIEWTGSRWLATGYSGKLLMSQDRTTWTQSPSGTSFPITGSVSQP